MRGLRPENYSDTEDREAYDLEPAELDHRLETITARNETHAFEIFCRKLCERALCPNLRPATGPEGGGDSKADTETVPVAEELATLWFAAETSAAKERWAFAFSAKKTWKSKVVSDVEGLAKTNRGYRRIICVTSRYARAKDRADLEKTLSDQYQVEVTIHDRSWIIAEILEKDRKDLAFNYLGVGREITSVHRLGPTDYSRSQQLADLELSLAAPSFYDGMTRQMVVESLLAAKLSRNLERPRFETEGRFVRAVRVADAHGSHRQRLEARYETLWTGVWWFDDVAAVDQQFDAFADTAFESDHTVDVEFVSNLVQVLYNSVIHDLLDRKGCKLDARAARLYEKLKALAANAERPNNALEARTLLALGGLNQAWLNRDANAISAAWPEFSDILTSARRLGEFDVMRFVKLVEVIGGSAGDAPAYDKLVDQIADLVSERKSEGEGARIRLTRAKQLSFDRNLDMIRIFGRVGRELVKREYSDDFIDAMQHLSLAYQSAGLFWAGRASLLVAAAHIAIEGERDGDFDIALLPTLELLAWQCLRLRHLPDMLLAHQTLRGALLTFPLSDASKDRLSKRLTEFDMALGSMLLNCTESELAQLAGLPDVLEGLDLLTARTALLYALGYEDELRADGSIPTEEPTFEVVTFMSILASQPVSVDWRASLVARREGVQVLKTIVLGMEIELRADGTCTALQVAELALAAIEAAFATTLDMRIHPHAESFKIEVSEVEGLDTPAFDIDPQSMTGQIHWPTGLSPGAFKGGLDTPGFLFQVGLTTMVATCSMPDFEQSSDQIAGSDAGADRIALIAASCNSYSRFFARDIGQLSEWDRFIQKSYPIRPDHPAISHIAPPALSARTDHLEEEDANQDLSLSRNHRKFETHSVIDYHLWSEVGWNGALYGTVGPGVPPILGFLFSDEAAARAIFTRWRERFGEDDVDDAIYLSIVTGITPSKPADYMLVVTSRPRETHAAAREGGARFMIRHHIMNPQSDENLRRFRMSYEAEGRFVLLACMLKPPSAPNLLYDLSIGKHTLKIVDAAELHPTDIEYLLVQRHCA